MRKPLFFKVTRLPLIDYKNRIPRLPRFPSLQTNADVQIRYLMPVSLLALMCKVLAFACVAIIFQCITIT